MKAIIVTSGTLMGGVYSLDKSLVIGRDGDCDIQILDPSASRRHASVTVHEGDTVIIVDLGSQNGTQVEDEPITEKVLEPGDSFTIGHVTFDYLELNHAQVESGQHGEINLLSGPVVEQSRDEAMSDSQRGNLSRIAAAATIPPSKGR